MKFEKRVGDVIEAFRDEKSLGVGRVYITPDGVLSVLVGISPTDVSELDRHIHVQFGRDSLQEFFRPETDWQTVEEAAKIDPLVDTIRKRILIEKERTP